MASWATVKSLALLFGPMLLPKAIAYYRSVRSSSAVNGPIRPVPASVSRALTILFVVAVISLISTIPSFAPENIFRVTQSRLQISTDVLFTRLQSIRPKGLTAADNHLRSKINSLESRLLYFQFGPDVLTNCLFCDPEDPRSYLYYAIPAILTPHLFNLCVLAFLTSNLFVGREGAAWRTTATIGAVGLAAAELWFLSTYNHQANARATKLSEIDDFFWNMRVYRGLAITALDALLGWVIYLSSTNRAFVTPPLPAERVEQTIKVLDAVRSKMSATGVVRNTVNRDEGLRARSQGYWVHEGRLMSEMMEDREVVEGINNALEGRIKIEKISADAEAYAKNMMGGMGTLENPP